MKTREEQIEEMVEIMCDDFGASFFAERLYAAGYRKQSDTAREILKPLYDCIIEHSNCCVNLSEDIKFLIEKYGVEVEE